MADEIRGATRIITDLRTPATVRPKEHVVWSPELYREVGVLAQADLELAHMLDELDAKITGHNREVATFALGVTDAIQALQIRCAQLEARTLPGRIRRLRAWSRGLGVELGLMPPMVDELELPPLEHEASWYCGKCTTQRMCDTTGRCTEP